jgi:threonine synthase
VKYVSTRGLAPALGFEDVLLAGLARDGGLYVPEAWPQLSASTIAGLAGRPFADISVEVIHPYLGTAIGRDALLVMACEAYAGFGHPAVTPLVQVDTNRWILELFHGPTLAFKDVAMQLLARLMEAELARRGERATIVGATSGDTGGAAIEAFRGSSRVDVVVLFPHGRISDVQRRLMTTPTEPNVHAVAVEGTFDDCQALVKGMFNDHDFRDRTRLAALNSINWARIVAQIPYYFAAAVALGAPHRPVSFAVPTGNFGDIFAGYAAKCMGLPIERLVIASNSNDILPRAVASGIHEARSVVPTTSPSMDIQVSSNFERYLFEAQGRNPTVIRSQMAALTQSGRFEIEGGSEVFERDALFAAAASEGEVADAIRATRRDCGYLVDPHTACGMVAARRRIEPGPTPGIVLATAHAAKFPDGMEQITGERPSLPERLSHLITARERVTILPNDLVRVQRFVGERARTMGKGVA